jgi:hypothetical protein
VLKKLHGANGKNGKNGKNGTNGTNGTNGAAWSNRARRDERYERHAQRRSGGRRPDRHLSQPDNRSGCGDAGQDRLDPGCGSHEHWRRVDSR